MSFRAWRRQRARWIKGHLQTWLVLMRNPVRTLAEMGLSNFAMMQITLLGGIISAFAHAPLALFVVTAMLTSYDLSTLDFVIALNGYVVAFLSALTAAAVSRNISHIRTALTMPFYWPMLLVPASIALLELIVQPHRWAKTAHGVSARGANPPASAPGARSLRSAVSVASAQSA